MSRLVKQAFTLIELLVVIAIIGILSGLIVVSMSGVTIKASIAKSQVFSNSLRNSLMSNIIAQYTFDDITDYNTTTKILNSTAGNIPDSWANFEGQAYYGPMLKDASDCVSDHCLYFDGVDDIIQISSDLTGGLTSLTIEAWVNGQQSANIFKATNNAILLHFLGAGFYLVAEDATASGYLGWDSLPYSSWNHIAAVWDGSTMFLYLNGKKQATTRAFTGGATKKLIASSSLRIADYFNAGQPYFKGSIDNVRLYNAAIPVSQIKEQYYSGLNSLLANGIITKQEYENGLIASLR